MDDEKLYKQARARVENKIRNASDKDIIMDQEKEIMYYRRTIEHLKEKQNTFKEDNELLKQYENVDEIRIKNEDYIIKYNKDVDMFSLSAIHVKTICITYSCFVNIIKTIFPKLLFLIYSD